MSHLLTLRHASLPGNHLFLKFNKVIIDKFKWIIKIIHDNLNQTRPYNMQIQKSQNYINFIVKIFEPREYHMEF